MVSIVAKKLPDEGCSANAKLKKFIHNQFNPQSKMKK
jgi:hypothetical protein